ncbi:MAG: metallophosphoesterase [Clostridia bacterium]|nr:metallophosphoesterase [Clostridia bacterium]
MKKLLSVLLAVLLMFSAATAAFAADTADGKKQLQFREDGSFTILNICDIQDIYPMNRTSHTFIEETLELYKPDLVILGGDNTVADQADMEKAIEEICDLFVSSGTYFTLVFGNHDEEHGVSKEDMFAYYLQYGGEYCLAYEADEALSGVGTHNLTILSSDGEKVAFNLYMFDSGAYANDENGNRVGYDCVHEDQLEWYQQTSAALAEENGGEVVPAMAFQHIIVQEVYDALFMESPIREGKTVQKYDEKSYTFLPKVANMISGLMMEFPCPGYYNRGQLDASAEVGDMVAIVNGHDHVNSFTVRRKGIDIVSTPGCTYHSYGKVVNRGCRVIVLNENEPKKYETFIYTVAEQALKKDSALTQYGDINKAQAFFGILGGKLLRAIVDVARVLFFYVK